ncbi:Nuclear autoantigenic sperm protein [Thelohanellus kitauei]|uniref:Nuclear autoantigenic sperm protein n=1 Tax=Thelohanellus kitauei TaxID=669202 RepID=A0A0C2IIH0_THEKT|nr:Nuclear autoantigenic sperm protein [Thelohanellus kitauei]
MVIFHLEELLSNVIGNFRRDFWSNSCIFNENAESSYNVPFHLKTEDKKDAEQDEEQDEIDNEDDLMVAWENLEAARLILDKNNDEKHKTLYADVSLYLGLINFENGLEDEACSEIEKSVSLLEDIKLENPRRYARSAFELGIIYGTRKMFLEARKCFENARAVLNDFLVQLKKRYNDNKLEIDEITALTANLDDKIQDCTECQAAASSKQETPSDKPVSNGSKTVVSLASSGDKLTEAVGSDITHLVKRKVPCY